MKRPEVTATEIYTIPETCRLLGVDRRTLRRWTSAGSIACHIRRCDGRIVYVGADIAKCYYDLLS